MTKIPEPGLTGDYSGSCAVCLRGTDTALSFKGEGDWLVAGLVVLGIPREQAATMVSSYFNCDEGMTPAGRPMMTVQVCTNCAAKATARFPVPGLVAAGAVPCVGQR